MCLKIILKHLYCEIQSEAMTAFWKDVVSPHFIMSQCSAVGKENSEIWFPF